MARTQSLVGGVDEAGRGCLAGPLVVAGVSADGEGVSELSSLGVKDSKKLAPHVRESMYPEILKACSRVSWTFIQPGEIDAAVLWGRKYRKLNYLEGVYFARVIDHLGAGRVTVDASDTVPARFAGVIRDNLTQSCKVLAVHKADRDFPVVSAASIVAKVLRDREVKKLRSEHGDFGSGYPSDPVTRRFFAETMKRGELLPEFVRKSWKTWSRL